MTHKLLGRTLAAAVLGLALYAVPAVAKHHGGKHKDKMFENLDANGDGAISKAEFLTNAEERFSKMDADGDGSITKEEGKAFHDAMKEKWKSKKAKGKDSE